MNYFVQSFVISLSSSLKPLDEYYTILPYRPCIIYKETLFQQGYIQKR